MSASPSSSTRTARRSGPAEAYRDVTGREDPLLTTGSGTYAHNFRRAISFGMESPAHDYPGWVGPMHGADEGVPEE